MVPRYSRPAMTAIWSPENRYRIWWAIEVFAAEAMGEIGMIPAEDAQLVRRIARLLGPDAVFVMLSPPTAGSDYGRDFSNLFPDLATEYKTAYLPFLLENVATKKELNQSDGIHPNAQGEVIMTENVYKELKLMLPK